MTYTGWIKVWRQIFDHPVVGCRGQVYSRAEAWLDLIAMAAFEPTRALKRGELIASRRFLAKRWRWSEKSVRCFLKALETEGMIARKTGAQVGAHLGAHLSICKYEQYQHRGPTQGPRLGPKDKKEEGRKVNTRARASVPEAPRAPRFNPTTHRKFVETLQGDELSTAWAKIGEGLQQRLAKFNGGH